MLAVVLAACAKGGSETRPESEVQIATNHHVFGFRSLAGFDELPIDPARVVTDRGLMSFAIDSTYSLSLVGHAVGTDTYALTNAGELALYITGNAREPSVVFRGAYDHVANDGGLFFTDRVSTISSPSIGLFVATEVIPGAVELEGEWHLASMHVIFGQSIQSPDNVARACWGNVAVAAGAPGTQRAIVDDGSGLQNGVTAVFGGTITNVLQNGTGDGSCDLTLSYQTGSQTADSRGFHAAAGTELVIGLDADEGDGEAGLAFLLRKFDPATAPAALAEVDGTFLVGGYTTFVNPADPGSDAFVGVVTIGDAVEGPAGVWTSPFRLDATGNQGIDFGYFGTATHAADQSGGMRIVIADSGEVWHAAISRDYKTLIFVDDDPYVFNTGSIELNLGIGVRQLPQ
ncbi:MAG: hypothetical protein KDC98_12050 [Planctomycetes bacterium]|nr:hypothetical protein [Planctomycetota bacterium]